MLLLFLRLRSGIARPFPKVTARATALPLLGGEGWGKGESAPRSAGFNSSATALCRHLYFVYAPVALAIPLFLALPNRLHAHGDLHLQITQVTEQLAKDPKNAELYLRRGELH